MTFAAASPSAVITRPEMFAARAGSIVMSMRIASWPSRIGTRRAPARSAFAG